MTVAQGDKPFFRYGSGQWGQALFRVDLQFGGVLFSVYSLPSENVPVLVGMRELRNLSVVLHCGTSKAIIMGQPRILRKTRKGHLLLDLTTDIPCPRIQSHDVPHVRNPSASTTGKPNARRVEFSGMLEFVSHDECVDDFHVCSAQFEMDKSQQTSMTEFLDLSESQWNFLSSAISPPEFPSEIVQPISNSNVGIFFRNQDDVEGGGEGSSGRRKKSGISKYSCQQCKRAEGQSGEECSCLRRDQNNEPSEKPFGSDFQR